MKIKKLQPKSPILMIDVEKCVGVDIETKKIYISRVTEATIISISESGQDVLWRRDNGKLKKHISLSTDWRISQPALDAIEVYIEQHGTVHYNTPVYFSGYRPRFNDKGIEVFDVPIRKSSQTVEQWLESLGFAIEYL